MSLLPSVTPVTRERIAKLPKDDWRKGHADFNEPNLSRNLALVERLKQIGKRHGRSPGEVAELIRKLGYEPVWKDWDAALTA